MAEEFKEAPVIGRPQIKVIHGRKGVHIQEVLGDQVKIYSPKEWSEEKVRRIEAAEKAIKKADKPRAKKPVAKDTPPKAEKTTPKKVSSKAKTRKKK